MPSSVPYAVPIIANIARQLRPAHVLDVGVGFGKYGYLLREYTDIWDMQNVDDYRPERWKTIIDGVDATTASIIPLHEYVYDTIHIGDITELVDTLGSYDVIIMGDVLEHFDKPIGERLLDKLYEHTNKCLLLTFPPNCRTNDSVIGNPYEAHRSAWNGSDFRRFPRCALNGRYKRSSPNVPFIKRKDDGEALPWAASGCPLGATQAHRQPKQGLPGGTISRLNSTAFALAVYASHRQSLARHARLASGCWPALPDGNRTRSVPTRGFRNSSLFFLLSHAFVPQG